MGARPQHTPVARLRTSEIAIYALPMISVGFMVNLVSFYLLKFSTDVLLIAPGIIGLAFGLSRAWDAVSDPFAGYWSDRTRSRWGRRRPWLIGSALPLSLAFLGLWAPPGALGGTGLATWMCIFIFLFFTAQTAFVVPHISLGAELTPDHHDRTRVFAGRMILETTGVLLAAGGLFLLERGGDARATAAEIAVVAAVFGAVLVLSASARLRERPEHWGRGGHSATAAFRDVGRNPHARLLLAVFFLETMGFTTMITTMPYATEYVLEMRGMAAILISCALGMMFLTVPLWIALSRRIGKKNVWLCTMLLRSLAFGLMLASPPGARFPIFFGVVAIGAAFGAGGMIGPSIKADVIDWDEARTGERKEGTYFALWNFATKSGAAVAVAMAGLALQWAGFRANVEQTPEVASAIRTLFAGLPCLLYGIAAVLVLYYRLDEREHGALRTAIAERRLEEESRHS